MTPRRGPAERRDLRGRAVTVMGLGLQGGGVELARYLARCGARVTVTDLRPAEQLSESLAQLAGLDLRYVLGGHDERDFTAADLVVANPAVAPNAPPLVAAREAGVEVTSEAALFLEACPARLLLVTGTQGKSTTCQFTAQLLEAAGTPALLGGNIGRSLLGELDGLGSGDVVVMELSSYQLEALPPAGSLRPRVAGLAVVNVLSDHLERHGSQQNYAAAKRRLLELAGDASWTLLPPPLLTDGAWRPARGRLVAVDASAAAGRDLHVAQGELRFEGRALGRLDALTLPGEFQRTNALFALGLALAAGAAPEDLARGLPRLSLPEHRLQDLGRVAGHRVWDNGVSTTPDSTLSAVLALEPPLALLVGGRAKRLPLDGLCAASRGRVRRVLAFGADGAELARAFERVGVRARACSELEPAVAAAFDEMEADEALLFSPACASFDAYRNFKDRARAFRAALEHLRAEAAK